MSARRGALFVRQFAYFLTTAFMLGFALYLDTAWSERPRAALHHVLLGLLGLAFVFYALSTYGRREFLYPYLICLLIWLVAGPRRVPAGLGLLLALAALWFALYSFYIPATQASVQAPGQPAAVALELSHWAAGFTWDAYFRTLQGLGDSFMHFVAAQHATLWQFGFLTDLWEIPLQLVPSQVLGFDRPRGMFGETSAFILGHPLQPGLSGEEPLGLHGYLLVNFSYLGMFAVFFLLGMGLRWVDSALRPPVRGSALRWLMFLWVVFGALEFLREGVLILVLKPRSSWWLALGVLFWLGYRRIAGRESSLQQSQAKDTS